MIKKVLKLISCWFVIFILLSGKLYSQNQQWHLSGPPGGIITELAVISDELSTIVAANLTPFTGLAKSSDGGESWEVLNGGLEFVIPEYRNSSIHAFAIDTVFPDTMFISIRSSYSTYGLYRTQDGGENWQIIMEDINSRAIAAKNGRVYVSSESGGLLASFDGGETWQDIAPALSSATHILFDPEYLDTLYVGTENDGLYRSPNGGLSFEQIGFQGERVTALDVANSDSCRLIIAAIGYFAGDSVFVSQDNGASWISRNNGLPPIEPFGPVESLLISPQNQNILYAGTVDGVYKSVDQGFNWFPVNNGLGIPTVLFPNHEPVLVLTLVMDRNDFNVLYAGTDRKGLFKTTNGGEQWSLIGVPACLVTGLSVSPLNSELIYAGAEDGFYVKRDGRWIPTTLWGSETSGVKSVASSPIDSNLVLATYRNAIGDPLIYKSTDGGETWQITMRLFEGSEVWNILFDPIFPERVYGVWGFIRTGGLIISDDSGDTWDLKDLGGARDMAINPVNSDILYLLERSGKVQQSDDRGVNWTTIKAETDTEHYAIAIDPFNPENIYLGTNTVLKSLDGGDTWIRTGLNQWVLDLAFDENSGHLYAATYGGGVVFTSGGGETWELLGDIPANPYLNAIDVGESEGGSIIYAGSFGSGVFEWSEEMTPVHPPENNNRQPGSYALLQNYPNPFNSMTDIRYQIPDIQSSVRTTLKIFDILGREVRTLVDEGHEPGYYTVTWDGRNDRGSDMASGVYFYRLTAGEFTDTKRMVLMK